MSFNLLPATVHTYNTYRRTILITLRPSWIMHPRNLWPVTGVRDPTDPPTTHHVTIERDAKAHEVRLR